MKKMTMTQWLGSIWYSCLTDSNKMAPSVEFKKIREVALNLKHSALDKLIDWLIVKWYHVCTQIVPNSVYEFLQAYSCWQICQVVVADSANSELLPSSVLTFWQVCSCWAESAKLIVTSDWLWLWERNGLTTQMVARCRLDFDVTVRNGLTLLTARWVKPTLNLVLTLRRLTNHRAK